MYNKLLLLVICIIFGINIQSVSAQADEKWLPSSVTILNNMHKDTMSLEVEYDSFNRIVNYTSIITEDNRNKITKEYIIRYGSGDNQPTELTYYNSENDIIKGGKRYTLNYPQDNKIEIKHGTTYTNIIYLDSDNGFPTKFEETETDSMFITYTTTSFEYKNKSLSRRSENILIIVNPTNKDPEDYFEPEVKYETTTYNYDAGKKILLEHVSLRWLTAYMKFDDILAMPNFIDETYTGIKPFEGINISVRYNDNGYKSGWEILEEESGEKVYCNIEYVKAK